jgi:hypothetical protein
MKATLLFLVCIFSPLLFGQKTSVRRTSPTKSVVQKPAPRKVTSTPRTNSSSRPSTPVRNTRQPSSKPSSSFFAAPSIQQHNTRRPAPHSFNSGNSGNTDDTGRVPSTSGSNSTNTSRPTNTANTNNYFSQSAGTNPNTGYYNASGPMVGVSGTGFEYGRLARLTGGQYVNYASNQVVRALQDVITQNANDSTDIVILVDISGSMKNNVKDIAKESHKIVQDMPFGSRLGGAVFKYSKSPQWFAYSDLDEDHYHALDLITKKRKYMSSESHYDALLKAINSNTWRNRKRMIITLTDEFIESGENFNTESTVVSAANSKNIELHTIMLTY